MTQQQQQDDLQQQQYAAQRQKDYEEVLARDAELGVQKRKEAEHEVALERERRAEGCVAVVNNHSDTDGLCATYAVLHPREALALEQELLDAAAAGGGISSAVARALGDLHTAEVLWQDAVGRYCLVGSEFAATPPKS